MNNRGLLGKIILILFLLVIALVLINIYRSSNESVEISTGNIVVNIDFNDSEQPVPTQPNPQEDQVTVTETNISNITEDSTSFNLTFENLSENNNS